MLQAFEAANEAVAGVFRNKEEFRAALVRTLGRLRSSSFWQAPELY